MLPICDTMSNVNETCEAKTAGPTIDPTMRLEQNRWLLIFLSVTGLVIGGMYAVVTTLNAPIANARAQPVAPQALAGDTNESQAPVSDTNESKEPPGAGGNRQVASADGPGAAQGQADQWPFYLLVAGVVWWIVCSGRYLATTEHRQGRLQRMVAYQLVACVVCGTGAVLLLGVYAALVGLYRTYFG